VPHRNCHSFIIYKESNPCVIRIRGPISKQALYPNRPYIDWLYNGTTTVPDWNVRTCILVSYFQDGIWLSFHLTNKCQQTIVIFVFQIIPCLYLSTDKKLQCPSPLNPTP